MFEAQQQPQQQQQHQQQQHQQQHQHQGPRVRSACEACHKRKQRCVLPEAGGACHACQQNARHCYFVPRFRPGRPQRRQTSDAGLAGAGTSTGPGPDSAGRGGGSSRSTFAPSGLGPSPPASSPDLQMDLAVVDHAQLFAPLSSLQATPQHYTIDAAALKPHPGQDGCNMDWHHRSASYDAYTTRVDVPSETMGESSSDDLSFQDAYAADVFDVAPLCPIPPRTISAKLAKHFIGLESWKESLTTPSCIPATSNDLQGKLAPLLCLIADICPQSRGLAKAHSGAEDPSLPAIMTATMAKIIELCEIVVNLVEPHLAHRPATTPPMRPGSGEPSSSTPIQQDCSLSRYPSPPSVGWPNASSSDCEWSVPNGVMKLALTLKQVEIGLTQAETCISLSSGEISAQAACALMERGTGLHYRINSIVDGVCVG